MSVSGVGVPQRQRTLIRVALERTGMTSDQLWLRYFALGGVAGPEEVNAFLEGRADLPGQQQDCLAVAINERLDELTWRHRVPYADKERDRRDDAGPLGALTDLLRGTHMAPPERVVEVLDEAATHLGVRVEAYLADHAHETLVPLRRGAPGLEAMGVDSSLAGRCFRQLETQRSRSGDHPVMWLPIIDGVERVGVLAVAPEDPGALDDPTLHRQVWWLTHYLGHMVDVLDRYGDALDRVRRRRPRSVAAELVWDLLPPLDAATDKVVISARLEPSDDLGGDVFDFTLSEHAAEVTVLDATGHDLTASLAAAAAVSALRNGRREGHGMLAQAELASRVLEEVAGGDRFATAVLLDLDLDDGRLRYLSAGHPAPLLLRDGQVVKSLDGGRRPLLGLEAAQTSIGQEQLQPGDVVVLYTDGVVDARDDAGRHFGLPRLVDFLERQHAGGTPLPEVVRRLCKAILEHQDGVLHDDATLVLVHWTTQGQASLEPELLV